MTQPATIAEVKKLAAHECIALEQELYCPSHGVLHRDIRSLLDLIIAQDKEITALKAQLQRGK